ncbi:nucleoside hydrolase, partial [Corynebacterium sp.]
HGADLVIIPTGPSTTVAAAMRQDPSFAANAHLVMMGGALTVPGNVTPWSEANISQDPEATDYLFRHAGDITMVGLDVTLRTLLTAEESARWRASGTRAGRIFADMVDYYIGAYATTSPYLGGCGLHDPLAVAVAADASLVDVLSINLKTDTTGPTRGRTIADETRLSTPATAKVAVGVDSERFVREFVELLETLFSEL